MLSGIWPERRRGARTANIARDFLHGETSVLSNPSFPRSEAPLRNAARRSSASFRCRRSTRRRFTFRAFEAELRAGRSQAELGNEWKVAFYMRGVCRVP